MNTVIIMSINEIIVQSGMTKYRVAKLSGIPHATLNDLCSGKSHIEKCSGETLYKLAKALGVSIECLLDGPMAEKQRNEQLQLKRERSYEYGLPQYLQHDLDAFKEGLKDNSSLMDCLWGELYGSINIAEINDGAITPEHADYLRQILSKPIGSVLSKKEQDKLKSAAITMVKSSHPPMAVKIGKGSLKKINEALAELGYSQKIVSRNRSIKGKRRNYWIITDGTVPSK